MCRPKTAGDVTLPEIRIMSLKSVLLVMALTSGLASLPRGHAAEPITSMNQLVRMSRCELEQLYRAAAPATAPDGFVKGRAIWLDTKHPVLKSRATQILWQGKYFLDDATIRNRVFGIRAFRADVFNGESWLDGGPSLIMDYQNSSKLFSDVRDEVRELSPGLYIGITYLRKCPTPELAMFFALEDRKSKCR